MVVVVVDVDLMFILCFYDDAFVLVGYDDDGDNAVGLQCMFVFVVFMLFFNGSAFVLVIFVIMIMFLCCPFMVALLLLFLL